MDPSFLAAYERRGRTLHIDEGQALTVDVPVISLRQ
jgi:hypothetical protein